jgi:hypothetical protein
VPHVVSTGIREALDPAGFQVRVAGKVIGEFWLRKKIPLKEFSATVLGVSFGRLGESTLMAVVRFPNGWSDYKGKPVPSGVYTLRYGIQPADGNHMGASIYRDFLLLLPASTDEDLNAFYSHDRLTSLSTETSGSSHPAVLSLFPVFDELTTPRLAKNELDQWVIEVSVESLSFALVVVGEGDG